MTGLVAERWVAGFFLGVEGLKNNESKKLKWQVSSAQNQPITPAGTELL